jgi:hypothetical protein
VWGTCGELRSFVLPETGGGICGSSLCGIEHIVPLLYLNRFLGGESDYDFPCWALCFNITIEYLESLLARLGN